MSDIEFEHPDEEEPMPRGRPRTHKKTDRKLSQGIKLWHEYVKTKGYLVKGSYKKMPKAGTDEHKELKAGYDDYKRNRPATPTQPTPQEPQQAIPPDLAPPKLVRQNAIRPIQEPPELKRQTNQPTPQPIEPPAPDNLDKPKRLPLKKKLVKVKQSLPVPKKITPKKKPIVSDV